MSVICRHFVQNAWRKDLCSNCFKSEEEHAALGPWRSDALLGLDELTRRYVPQARPYSAGADGSLALRSTALLRGLQQRADEAGMGRLESPQPAADGSLMSSRLVQLASAAPGGERVHAAVNRALVPAAAPRGILVLDGRGRGGRQKRSIAFSDEPEVIGFGGEPAESDDEPDAEPAAPEAAEPSDALGPEERSLLSLTKRNTDFNSINSNLSGTSRTLVDWVDENDVTTERSALTGRHKKFTPLVSIAPFSAGRSAGGVKVNLVAPMKNGEIVTENRGRFEMVEKRTHAADPVSSAKIAEKITRLDDLIDEKPRKTTSVEITSGEAPARSLVTETVSVTEFEPSSDRRTVSPPLVETRLSFTIGARRDPPPAPEGAPPAEAPRSATAPASGQAGREEVERVVTPDKDDVERAERVPWSNGVATEATDASPSPRAASPEPVQEAPSPSVAAPVQSDASPVLRESVLRVAERAEHDKVSEAPPVASVVMPKEPSKCLNERKYSAPRPTGDDVKSRDPEKSRQSAHSSALQRLIDEDVDNQRAPGKRISPENGPRTPRENGSSPDEAANKVNLIKSRFSEKLDSPKEQPVSTNRPKTGQAEAPRPSNGDGSPAADANSAPREDSGTSTKSLAPSPPQLAKPSPRASFLHSLTNHKPDDADNTFSGFLSSTLLSASVANDAPNGRDSCADNRKDDVASEVTKTAPGLGSFPKANDSGARSPAKTVVGISKPPILREKPKIAAKPAKLHRLSRTTSIDSDSCDRMTPEIRETELAKRDEATPEPPEKEKAPNPNKEGEESSGEPAGSVCVEVKSPMLDASTRLSKLVESAKKAPEEPVEKNHLTISLSPPRPPARKESMTRKERTMQREKELEKQREELEKRNREEQDDDHVEKKPADVRREHRPAPQPPTHKELERTVSREYEANRAAIANLLSLGHRSSAIKRQAPRAPDNAGGADESSPGPQPEARRSCSAELSQATENEERRSQSPRLISEVKSGDDPQASLSVETEHSEDKRLREPSDAESTESPDQVASVIPGAQAVDRDDQEVASSEIPEQDQNRADGCNLKKTGENQDRDVPVHVTERDDTPDVFKSEDAEHQEDTKSSTAKESESENVPLGSTEEMIDENPPNQPANFTKTMPVPEEPSNLQNVDAAEPEPEPISRITLQVKSATPPQVSNDRADAEPDEAILQKSRDVALGEPPMSLPARPNGAGKLAVMDDGNPYASTAIFDRRSSFKPSSDDDDDDLPPSASMRSSSVSPRSRKRHANVVSFDPSAELYSRETVLIKPRSQSMPRSGQMEGLMTDEEVKKKIYGVSSAGVFGPTGGGERKSRRDEPKRRGKFSLKKFLKFGKDDKKKERERAGEQRAKPEIIHPIDLTPAEGKVEVIVRTEEEKRRDEAERQRKKALLIAEGTKVYDSPSFSKNPGGRPLQRSSPTGGSTPHTPTSAPWQHGSLGFNSEGRPKPPPPPRRTSSIDQSEATLAQTPPSRPPPPNPEAFSRSRDGSDRSADRRETEYANLGTNRAGLTPRKPDRGGSVRQESPKLRVVFDADSADAAATQPTAAVPAADSPNEQEKPPEKPASPSDGDLPRQRPSRVSLRKQTSVVHANLEENYDAVTASNHEALLQLLEQVSSRRPTPAALRPLEHNPALAFTHFKVAAETHVTCGRRAFLRASHRDQAVLLMLSSEPAATPAASLPPLAQFRDLVQGHLLPKASTGSYTSAMQATVWVLPPVTVRPLWELAESQPAVVSQQQEQQVCLLLLQTVHHLLELQARGQQFVDQSLCELVATDADGDPQSRLVAIYGNYEGRQKLTACQAALAVMLRMLGVQDALERVRDGRGISVPDVPSLNAFELLANLLLREDSSSLRRARAVLEYLLWGPADVELTEAESSLQRWLDLERATVLNNLIRTQKLWSVELSVLEEFRLMFLVRTDSATLKDASALLDI